MVFRAFVFGFLLLFFNGCQKKAAEIVIGTAGPMTGDQSKLGGDVKNGVLLAVDEWNDKGGIGGMKIRLEVGDDQHDPKQAVSVANKMVNMGIIGMVGHFNSSASIPASSVYQSAGIPMITPGSTNPKLTDQGYKTVFRVCGRDDQQGKVAAQFAAHSFHAKKIAILHDKTTYGQGLAEEFQKSILSVGAPLTAPSIEIVSFDGITQGDKDFRGILTSLKGKNPDLFFFGGIFPEGGLLVKQAREIGLMAPMMSGDGVIDPKFIEIAGEAAEGTYLTFTPDPEKIPNAQPFLKKYKTRHGNELAPYAIYAYDATNILLTAISQVGTKEMRDGKKIAEIIRNLKYDGALGHIEFDAKGDVKESPYIVWVTKGGKFEEFWKPQS
ncbi:MAG: branched-chain amino acid ABC transporter substrate-binding protein [Nitrospirae bacterium]|nr:branched-chain amino acid ABC transporter substrate-binding protein [Candidatus Troglogloeales bacterium]